MKDEGRGKKDEGRRKKDEGRGLTVRHSLTLKTDNLKSIASLNHSFHADL
jgi:hypothetical protein